jgi:hypothetical protein
VCPSLPYPALHSAPFQHERKRRCGCQAM